MTREERLELLKQIEKDIYVPSIESTFLEDSKSCAIHSVIEELEKESCEDAISRQAVLDLIEHYNSDGLGSVFYGYEEGAKFANEVNKLPPVTPEQKTGHWIEHDWESVRKMGYYRCSVCKHGYQRYERGVRKSDVPYINGQSYELHRIDNFCPNCGAKMESEK